MSVDDTVDRIDQLERKLSQRDQEIKVSNIEKGILKKINI